MKSQACELDKDKAKPQNVLRSGLGVTDLSADRGKVFEKVDNPPAWLVRLYPVASAYGEWRRGLPLKASYGAVALGWRVHVDLQPGILLDSDSGLPGWQAERAVEGLRAGEPHCIEMAAGILLEAKGCVLDLADGVSAVLVSDRYLRQSVTIEEALLLFDEGEALSV